MNSLCALQLPSLSAVPALSALVVALGGLSAGTAQAQAFDAVRLYGAATGMSESGGHYGGILVNSARYMGAETSRTALFPLLDYQWKSGWFAGTGNGVGFNFARGFETQYGLRVTADFGRQESSSPDLKGMGDIDIRPQIGAFFNTHFSPEWFVTSSMRYGSGQERKGALLDLGLGYSTALSTGYRISANVGATLANRSYMQDYFGVSADQAARSAYAVYQPRAGLRDVRTGASIGRPWGSSGMLTAAVGGVYLRGDAIKSPLVRKSGSFSLALVYTRSF